ncbi:hypothetical protein CC79DRAFT_1286342 [Sarocladium strictum]
MVLKKFELEGALAQENLMIKSGELREENPLDTTAEFNEFLLACRHGDLRKCQELISQGVNINGKDKFDYTPLIIVSGGLASLCGHYELVQLLLESGALAERNTFQGERCIYNALNDRIRNLLLQYDFSKSSDPYVYWSTHISTLLNRSQPATADITLQAGNRSFQLHKFLLSSRTPYFGKKLEAQPDTTTWKLSSAIPVEAFQIVLRYLYLGDVPKDLVPQGSPISEEEVAKGLDKVSRDLGVEHVWEAIMVGGDRRLARQRYQDEVARALKQVEGFFQDKIIQHKMVVDVERVGNVKWKHDNSIFADVLLRADEPEEDAPQQDTSKEAVNGSAIPIGPAAAAEAAAPARPRKAVLYPVHKAMLIRSEYFERMFSGDFLEAQQDTNLRVVTVDCTPPVLELILSFLYTESVACPLEHALDLLYAADMLFLDTLKTKAAQAISTLGSGTSNLLVDRTHQGDDPNGTTTPEEDVEPINIYDIIHAAWDLRVQRLEEFAARYLAYRLEDYIDEADFQDLIRESAERLTARQETDTIELLDDIRYYLSERFRLRFEDAGLEDMMDEEGEINAEAAAALVDAAAEAREEEKVEDKTAEGEKEGAVVTLDGAAAEDEFESDAMNYQILLGKIDEMLERLKLDA